MLGSDLVNHLKYKTTSEIKLKCLIDLNQLLPTEVERSRFDNKWEAFLTSDKTNPKIFKIENNTLIYESEQLIPEKRDKRPPLLLVLGNPASHSVHAGMFFSFEKNRKEHRFWKSILKPAGILDMSEANKGSIDEMNHHRREQLWNLDYKGPFRVGLCVFFTIPSVPGGKWGGVAGIQKLMGIRALRRLQHEEAKRIHACADKFLGSKGRIVVFQKSAWNALRSDNDPEYRIDSAKSGLLRGKLNNASGFDMLGIPPTRLSGPCSQVLRLIHKPEKCPACGSLKVAKIFYGMPAPSPQLEERIRTGEIVLGGCCITGDDPMWKCLDCETLI